MTRAFRLSALLLCLVAAGTAAASDSTPETALDDYVAAPDDSYAWRVHARYELLGAEIVELRLHSQTWRDVLWRHTLHVIRPNGAGVDTRQGLLYIGGGRWRDEYESETEPPELTEEAALFVALAEQLDTVVAVLGQVPFQPIFGLREDELIAHTFVQYLQSEDTEWPLLLPMVKSAVRGMDTVQELAASEWSIGLDGFTVMGGSKRGWTTWLTGAVDPRARVLVPIVIDALNLEAHMEHQEAVWGEPSEAISPYTRRGLHEVLASDAGRALRRIVDPYSYRERLTQPKLIVIGTNDEYFPLDALNLYWDELPEPKRVLYLPNDGHSIDDIGRLLPALAALHRHGETGEPLGRLEWEFERSADGLRLCVEGDPEPDAFAAWTAESEDTDFRDERFSVAGAGGGGPFVFELPAPDGGYAAVFAEATFGDGLERYNLSTNVRVIGPAGESPTPASAAVGHGGVCSDADAAAQGKSRTNAPPADAARPQPASSSLR